jgi:hypothetical protein
MCARMFVYMLKMLDYCKIFIRGIQGASVRAHMIHCSLGRNIITSMLVRTGCM